MDKITVVGDIICDNEMLNAAKREKDKYCFDDMFSPLIGYFDDSNYVIGNLETTISNCNYTNSVFSFNNPETLLKSLKDIGIDAVSLANNHILDRGKEGISSTVNLLQKYNIDYFGINNKNLYIDLEHCKVCLLAYTDSTNYHINKCLNVKNVNLLKPSNISIPKKKKNVLSRIYHRLNPNIRIRLKNIFKRKIKPIVDVCSEFDELNEYMFPLIENITSAKKLGYYIIMYPHMGGQFNVAPGKYVLKMVDKFKVMGCDSIIITHPHVVQTMKYDSGTFCFYSIGGLIISPTSKFVLWETKPQYSLVVHYYFNNNKLVKLTCSFLICVSDKKSYLKIYPFYEFYNKSDEEEKTKFQRDFIEVYNRLFNTNKSFVNIENEFVITEVEND